MTDDQLNELANRAATSTPLSRLSHAEQRVVFRWLADNGYINFTDAAKSLEPAPPPRRVSRYDGAGQPIAWDGETEFYPQASPRSRLR
jgi:hypothetical protein